MEVITNIFVYIGTIGFFSWLPIFLVFFLIHFFKIIRLKNRNETVSKALIKKSKIYGAIFVATVLFYVLVMYLLSRAIAYM